MTSRLGRYPWRPRMLIGTISRGRSVIGTSVARSRAGCRYKSFKTHRNS